METQSVMEDIKCILDVVRQILIKYPECRDSYPKLMEKVWMRDIQKESPFPVSQLNISYFFELFTEPGKLTSFHSIERAFRKIQEQHPELRGETYYKRHKQEQEVRAEINTI